MAELTKKMPTFLIGRITIDGQRFSKELVEECRRRAGSDVEEELVREEADRALAPEALDARRRQNDRFAPPRGSRGSRTRSRVGGESSLPHRRPAPT
jgi:hypothetical protein